MSSHILTNIEIIVWNHVPHYPFKKASYNQSLLAEVFSYVRHFILNSEVKITAVMYAYSEIIIFCSNCAIFLHKCKTKLLLFCVCGSAIFSCLIFSSIFIHYEFRTSVLKVSL